MLQFESSLNSFIIAGQGVQMSKDERILGANQHFRGPAFGNQHVHTARRSVQNKRNRAAGGDPVKLR